MQALAEQPFLARVRYLTIDGQIKDRGVAALADSLHLGNLDRLNLLDTGMSDKGAVRLAEAENLSCSMLALSGNEIGDEGVAALADSPVLASVERLYLARNPIGDDGVIALANSPHLGKLRELGLGTLEDLSDEGARALVDSPHLTALDKLEVDCCYDLSSKMLASMNRRFARLKGS